MMLMRRYSPALIFQQFREGTSLMLVVWAAVSSVVSLLLMSTADWLVFRGSLKSISWTKVVRGRGAMSLIAALNYGAGQGSYGIWISRSSGTGLGKTVGLIAYMMLSDLTAVSILAASALAISGMPLASDLRWLVVGIAPAIATGLLLAGLLGPTILPRLFNSEKILGLVSPWSSVPAKAYLASVASRVTNRLLMVTFSWAAAKSFGIDVPLAAFMTYLPIVYLVGSLPINVGPVGAVQVAWLHFFAPYGSGEQILAFQILFSTLLTIGWAARGLPFVGKVSRELRQGGGQAHSKP